MSIGCHVVEDLSAARQNRPSHRTDAFMCLIRPCIVDTQGGVGGGNARRRCGREPIAHAAVRRRDAAGGDRGAGEPGC